jgi:hypothetical protein
MIARARGSDGEDVSEHGLAGPNLGIRTRLPPCVTTALGASEVPLAELANAYRLMASGYTRSRIGLAVP